MYNFVGYERGAYQKAIALLERPDWTAADKIAEVTVLQFGDDSSAALAILQAEWGKGPEAFAQLLHDWTEIVVKKEKWARGGLHYTLIEQGKLSGKDAKIAQKIFDSYDTLFKGKSPAPLPEAGDSVYLPEEQGQLHTAWAIIKSADDNPEQAKKAAGTIKDIWQKRIARAKATNNSAMIEQTETQWREQLPRLAGYLKQADYSDKANLRLQILMMGHSTADELYVRAQLDKDFAAALKLLDGAWGKEQIGQLWRDAAKSLPHPQFPNNPDKALRPSYSPFIICQNQTNQSRIHAVLGSDAAVDHARNGAHRLGIELGSGEGLTAVINFLKQAQSGNLRDQTIARFVRWKAPTAPKTTAEAKSAFLAYIAEQSGNGKSGDYFRLRDLIDPPGNVQETAKRAQEAYDAQVGEGSFWTNVADFFTGEDTQDVAQWSAERLAFMAAHMNSADVQLMLAMTGKETVADLVKMEKALFDARLADVRAATKIAVEALISILEAGAKMGITAVTGGVGLPAAMAISAVGMLIREGILGPEYNLMSNSNLKALVLQMATAGVGALKVGDEVKQLFDAKNKLVSGLANAGYRNSAQYAEKALQSAVSHLATESIQGTVNASLNAWLDGTMPKPPDINAIFQNLLIGSLAAGSKGALARDAGKFSPQVDYAYGLIREQVKASLISSTATLAQGNAKNLSSQQIFDNFAKAIISSPTKTYFTGAATSILRSQLKPEQKEKLWEKFREEAPETAARIEKQLLAEKYKQSRPKGDAMTLEKWDKAFRAEVNEFLASVYVPDSPELWVKEAEDTFEAYLRDKAEKRWAKENPEP